NRAWIETGTVSAAGIARIHRTALACHPVRRLLTGEPDREVGDLPDRLTADELRVHVEAVRMHHVVARVRDLDHGVALELCTLRSVGIRRETRPNDFGEHQHRSADISRHLCARHRGQGQDAHQHSAEAPHTAHPQCLAHHPSPFVAEKNPCSPDPPFNRNPTTLRDLIRANTYRPRLHWRAQNCLQLLEGRPVVKRKRAGSVAKWREGGRELAAWSAVAFLTPRHSLW